MRFIVSLDSKTGGAESLEEPGVDEHCDPFDLPNDQPAAKFRLTIRACENFVWHVRVSDTIAILKGWASSGNLVLFDVLSLPTILFHNM